MYAIRSYYEVIDGDGDTANGTMAINVDDDTPTLSPEDTYIVDMIGTPHSVTNALNFSQGADVGSPGGIQFASFTEGAPATDASGQQLTLNNSSLSLYWGNLERTIIEARTSTGDVGVRIALNTDGSTYTFETQGIISVV